MMKKFITIGIICLLLLVSIPSIVGVDKELLSMHENHPPDDPWMVGPLEGKPGVTYTFTFSTTDPNDDDVYYIIDWGDGSDTGWMGPFASGEEVEKSHKWSTQGTYTLRIKAKDIHGAESNWGKLDITMPKNKLSTNTFLLRLLEIFPILEKMLLHLIK